MIELTHEQWQAITHDENPTVIEPESKTAYVVVPRDVPPSNTVMVLLGVAEPVNSGVVMKVEFRNLKAKELKPEPKTEAKTPAK